MLDTKHATQKDFVPYLEAAFDVVSVEPALTLRLVEVKPLATGERVGGAFSLLWQGPADLQLAQGTYRLNHGDLGPVDLFLVPVAQTDEGLQYEAIFG